MSDRYQRLHRMKPPDDAKKVGMQESDFVAGIDWASELHAVCIIDRGGQITQRFDVTHDGKSLRSMVSRFRKAGVAEVAIERGDGPVETNLQGRVVRYGGLGHRVSPELELALSGCVGGTFTGVA